MSVNKSMKSMKGAEKVTGSIKATDKTSSLKPSKMSSIKGQQESYAPTEKVRGHGAKGLSQHESYMRTEKAHGAKGLGSHMPTETFDQTDSRHISANIKEHSKQPSVGDILKMTEASESVHRQKTDPLDKIQHQKTDPSESAKSILVNGKKVVIEDG